MDHQHGNATGSHCRGLLTILTASLARLVPYAGRHSHTFRMVAQVFSLRVLILGTSLATGLISAAALGPRGRGELAALTLAPHVLVPVALIGLNKALIFSMKADPESEAAQLGWAVLLSVLASGLTVAVAWCVLPLWMNPMDAEVVSVARLLLFILPVSVTTMVLMAALEAGRQFSFSTGAVCLQSLATLAALLVLWSLGALTPVKASLAYLLPLILLLVQVGLRVVRRLPPRLDGAPAVPRRLLHYSLRYYGGDVLRSLSSSLDQIFIIVLLAPEALGVYAVALSISRVLALLQLMTVVMLFPNVAAGVPRMVVAAAGQAARVAGSITAAAAVLLGVIGPTLLQTLYGDAFLAASNPLRLLLAEAVVSCMAGVLQQAFNGTNRPGVVSVIEVLGVASSVAMLLLLAPVYGVTGVALAVLVASSVRLACVLICIRTLLGEPMPRLVPSLADLRLDPQP
jgi:O-antigen/teichoic acid export membrane protein